MKTDFIPPGRKRSSACGVFFICLQTLMNASVEAKDVDPDRTSHIGAVWHESTLFA